MGRNAARTVEYFPMFVKFGKTIFLLEEKWGNDGFSFWVKLLMILGGSQNHYLDCSKDTQAGQENWDYLVARSHLSPEKCDEIIGWLSLRGNLDAELWKLKRIVWCQTFVDNLTEVYAHRKYPPPKRPFNGISSEETLLENDNLPGNGSGSDISSAGSGISSETTPIGRKEGRKGEISSPEISGPPPSSPSATPEEEDPQGAVLARLRAVNAGLLIQERDWPALNHLIACDGLPTVVAAYREQQLRKPGALQFFLADYSRWKQKIPPAAKPTASRSVEPPPPSQTPEEEKQVALEVARLRQSKPGWILTEDDKKVLREAGELPAEDTFPDAEPAKGEPKSDPLDVF